MSDQSSPIREPEISSARREEIARLVWFVFGDDMSAKAAMDPKNDAHWASWRGEDAAVPAFNTADAILNLAPVGGRGEEAKASPFLSFEDSLDRLVIYTAMEDGQLALNCERVIKAEYERLLTALQAKEEEIQSDVRAILALRSDLDAAQSALAEALWVLRPFARVYDELCGRGLSYAISGDDGVIYADDDNFADASDLVQRFSTGRVDGVEL